MSAEKPEEHAELPFIGGDVYHRELMAFLKTHGSQAEFFGTEFPSFIVPRLIMAFHDRPATEAMTIIVDRDLVPGAINQTQPVVAIRHLELGTEGTDDVAYEQLAARSLALPVTGAWFWAETLLWQGVDGKWRCRRHVREEILRRATHLGNVSSDRIAMMHTAFNLFSQKHKATPIRYELDQLGEMLNFFTDD